jgi:3-hydroxyisobutyryl-CoA hydrolase
MANVIIMSGAGPKAFCAGGDVAALAKYNQEGAEGQRKSREYFALEYQLDHLMATCKIPYIAYMDGITMGGGVGLSVHAPFRIATERTVFAMPETTIGFFPDVGGSFFLPRLDGFIGTYLALTSEQLRGVDVFYSGIATHYLHSSSLPDLTNRLSELRFQDYIPFKERLSVIAMTINEFVTGLPFNQAPLLSGPLRSAIDRTFSAEDIPTLLSRLSAESGSLKPWADKTLQTLHQRSPTSVHVALRQMRAGAHWGIAETFQREHGLASKFMAHPDFHSGVTARLINKPASTPEWEPPTLESQIDTDTLFAVEGSPRLQLLREGANADYHEYPHRHLGSPREKDVEAVVREAARSRKDVVTLFERQAASVQGIKEIVEEVLRRKTTEEGEGGFCRWVDGYGEEK